MIAKATGLGYKAGNKFIIKDVNWEIRPREHWIVFGLNGCGKTTLLSMISGYKSNSHGELELFGTKLTEQNMLDIRKKIGFVSSSFLDNFYSSEAINDIVLSGQFGALGLQSSITDEDVRMATDILTQFGLKSKLGFPYDILSKGERQKVLLARALIADPELLILDEPCSGMDLLSREYILNTISSMAEEKNITIIFVTHHTEEILPIFTKGLLIKKGKVHSQGAIKKVFSDENMTDFFEYPTEVTWNDQRVNISIGCEFGSQAS